VSGGEAYLLSLVRRHYAPEAVAQVGSFLLDRLRHRRMAGDTHVADQIFVRPSSPRSYHRVLAAQARHAGRRVTPFRDHRWVLTSCADIALRLPTTPRVKTNHDEGERRSGKQPSHGLVFLVCCPVR
jgi:hypothetical protein